MTEADQERYYKALHAVQTGVGYLMERTTRETDPKHLRVGVNSSLINSSALAKLLIDKGLITQDEYEAVLADFAEAEKASYEKAVNDVFMNGEGRITLG